MLDEEAGTLNLIASGGLIFAGLPYSMSLAEEGFSQRAFKEGKSVLIGDYENEPGAIPGAIARGLKSICSIGLRGTDGPNGLLNIASRHPDHFNQERLELLETIAGGIAALFESARLSENLEQTQREMAVADEVARIITSTLNIEAAYDEFFAEVRKLVDYDLVTVTMVTDDQQGLYVQYCSNPDRESFPVGRTYDLAGTLLGRLVEDRTAINIPDVTKSHDYWAAEPVIQEGFFSIYDTPLIFEDRVIGGMAFFSKETANFLEREGAILERLASLVAPSVRNAALYQEADRFASALDSIGEAVAFLDLDANIRHVNRAFQETFGYTPNELRRESIRIIADDGELNEGRDQEIFKQGILGGWTGEVLRRTKAGDLLNILLTVSPVTVGNQRKWDTFVKERLGRYGSGFGLPQQVVVAFAAS